MTETKVHAAWYDALMAKDMTRFKAEVKRGISLDENYHVPEWSHSRPPLHWAVRANAPEAIPVLLNAGANEALLAETEHGTLTAPQYAEHLQFKECVSAFELWDGRADREARIADLIKRLPGLTREKALHALRKAEYKVERALEALEKKDGSQEVDWVRVATLVAVVAAVGAAGYFIYEKVNENSSTK